MSFQDKENIIEWRVHFSSGIKKVYDFLATDQGRSQFWAERTIEKEDIIEFHILNYPKYEAEILAKDPPFHFKLEYFGTEVSFKLQEVDDGTDLLMVASTSNENAKYEMTAGWVSVLLAMKAAVDFGVDLRNHSENRAWEQGFVGN